MIVLLGISTAVYAAGGPKIFSVFERQYTVQIEPIEVVQLTWPIMTIKPGEPIELVYLIKNHDSQKHWNVVVELDIQGGKGAGLESTWVIQEEKTSYTLGEEILIPTGFHRTLEASFFPTEDITLNVRIYRTTSVQEIG